MAGREADSLRLDVDVSPTSPNITHCRNPSIPF
jgi:hypothetical protein